MSFSRIGLALLLFFLAAGWLGWFLVSSVVLGITAFVTAILLVIEVVQYCTSGTLSASK